SPHMTLLTHLLAHFTAPSTTEIYTLSLHDALPISDSCTGGGCGWRSPCVIYCSGSSSFGLDTGDGCCSSHQLWNAGDLESQQRRSEEHTSELQSQSNLVCRLLLEKKKK